MGNNNNRKEVREPQVQVNENVAQEPVEKEAQVNENVTQEPVEKEAPKVGVVDNCSRLNVRVAPRITADVRLIINKGEEVTLCEKQPKGEWFRVRTQDNTEGFCMKKYITIQ